MDFFVAMGSPSVATHSLLECCVLAESLITEEVLNETLPALRAYCANPSLENKALLADGIVDSVYVLLHTANSLDIPFDLIWEEVHKSNMAKVNTDGTVSRREDGKVLKPEGWKPPNVFGVLMEWETEQKMGSEYLRKGMVS